jgi:hypothetical protein
MPNSEFLFLWVQLPGKKYFFDVRFPLNQKKLLEQPNQS